MHKIRDRVRHAAILLRLAAQKNMAADFKKMVRLSPVEVLSAFASISDADWLPIQATLNRSSHEPASPSNTEFVDGLGNA